MRYVFSFMIALAFAGSAVAIEGTARPVVDPSRELAGMQIVPVCPAGTPVKVGANGRLVCAPELRVPSCAAGVPLVVSGSGFACGSSAAAPTCSIQSTLGTLPCRANGVCPAGYTAVSYTQRNINWCSGDGGNFGYQPTCIRVVCN